MSSHRHILIALEDLEMRDLIGTQIVMEYPGLKVDQAGNGRDLLKQASVRPYDLAVVNWALPEISKTELLAEIRKIRSASELPVLVVMASSDPETLSLALEAGASECLSLPFERAHLLNKVKLFLRKSEPQSPDQIIWGAITLDIRTFDVYCGINRIHLTPSEFKLLQALVEHQGAAMTREKLIELVQGEGIAVIDRAVDTHIFSLRKKLGEFAEMVETVRGSGYRIKSV